MKTYALRYEMDGDEYELDIVAKDEEDARLRLRALGMTGRVDGEVTFGFRLFGWLNFRVIKQERK